MGCATRQDLKEVDIRLLSLEQGRADQMATQEEVRGRMAAMDVRVEAHEQDLRTSYARMRSEMDTLRLALQEMQGRMEESAFRSRGAVEKGSAFKDELVFLKDEMMKLSGRIQHLSDYVGLESAVVVPVDSHVPDEKRSGKKEEQTSAAPLDLDALYAEAKQAFDNGAFERARDGFQEILKRFPNSARADNAQFWIGEIYYRENWYEKAILEYQKVIDGYPKGNKVASALLKQGLAFEKLGQKANARLILEELVRKYPGSSESLIGQRKLRQL
jgi:tol-pal system protein YbgF